MASMEHHRDTDITSTEAMTTERSERSGYEATFCPELEKKYECPICLRAMREAMQTSCGHRFCESCIMAVVNQRLFAKCPVDNMWFRCRDELFPDNAVRREILSLTVKCETDDCLWRGELRNLEAHSSSCEYKLLSCEYGCSTRVRRYDLTYHMERCERRPVSCQHCNMSVTNNYLMKHQVLECDKFPVQCTLCGESGIQRDAIQRHLDKDIGNCPHAIIPCPYQKYGCLYEDKRQKISSHLSDCASVHLEFVVHKVETLEKQLDHVSQQFVDLSSMWSRKFAECTRQLEEIAAEQRVNYSGQMTWKIKVQPGIQQKYCSEPFYTGMPGYKLHAVLEISDYRDGGNNGFTSLFVLFGKGRFDDEVTFPINAVCRATVLGKQSPNDNFSETILCSNVHRCRVEGELFNFERGRLRFMMTELLLSPKYCKDNEIVIHISMDKINNAQ